MALRLASFLLAARHAALFGAGLSLLSCEDTMKLQAQAAEQKAKLESLNMEAAKLDAQLIEMRKKLPPSSSYEESARQVLAKAEGDLRVLQPQMDAAAADIKARRSSVAAMKMELDSLRAKTQ